MWPQPVPLCLRKTEQQQCQIRSVWLRGHIWLYLLRTHSSIIPESLGFITGINQVAIPKKVGKSLDGGSVHLFITFKQSNHVYVRLWLWVIYIACFYWLVLKPFVLVFLPLLEQTCSKNRWSNYASLATIGLSFLPVFLLLVLLKEASNCCPLLSSNLKRSWRVLES